MVLKACPPTTQPAAPVHRQAKSKPHEAAASQPPNHADYDRKPLRVNSMDHYVKVDSDGRFHVH